MKGKGAGITMEISKRENASGADILKWLPTSRNVYHCHLHNKRKMFRITLCISFALGRENELPGFHG